MGGQDHTILVVSYHTGRQKLARSLAILENHDICTSTGNLPNYRGKTFKNSSSGSPPKDTFGEAP